MKTQISFTKTDGSTGVALVDGSVDDPIAARLELANALNLAPGPGGLDDADSRLRADGIEPASVSTVPVSE